jgi:hypothetical protein
MLNSKYQELFEAMLFAASKWKGRLDVKLTACWPERGVYFQPGSGLMVIGRATNGFEPDFTVEDIDSPSKCASVAAKARTTGEQYQMGWLRNPYKGRGGGTTASRSSFWRVTAALIQRIQSDAFSEGRDWKDSLVWSNLAKVAPMRAGNPSASLLRIQSSSCCALLRNEIETFNPGIVLVIAGEGWCSEFHDAFPFAVPSHTWSEPAAFEHECRLWLFIGRPERHPEKPIIDALCQVALARRTG